MSRKKNIPGNFQEIPKVSPFKIPNGYFESFSDRLQQRITAGEKKYKMGSAVAGGGPVTAGPPPAGRSAR